MQIVAVIIGLAVGRWVSMRITDFGLMLFYLHKYRNERAYLALYDLLDDEHGYKLFKTHMKSADSYTKYLHLHQQARDDAYAIFRNYYFDITKYVLWHKVLLLLIALVFLSNWLFYLVPALIVMVGFVAYKRFIKGYGVDFYARLMMSSVLSEFNTQKP